MTPQKPKIRKFNPGTFQSDEEVIDQFVVRNRELAVVLDVLRDNVDARSCQQLLVVAPRGRGKTMLLARVAAELRREPAFCDKLLPVRFMEESHEVFGIDDFWMDALYHLANECASTGLALADELKGVHSSLASEWRDPRLADRARAAVLNAADRLGRQLVLMVENLQTLCDDVDDDFAWQLRESLQTEPQVMLLGTATSRFEALDDVDAAFFELFRAITLEPLDTEECSVLWQAITGEQVEWNEMRPLEILSGGSPRLLVIIADFARHRSFRQLLEELVTLVDDHTEYFRGHLDALPKTERRVYVAALDLWMPSSTSEIAARARMDVRTTSSMLGRLVDRGALTPTGPVRKRCYAATERLYCMYYKIRRKHDDAAVVETLIRFMALYYGGICSPNDFDHSLAKEMTYAPDVMEGMIRALRDDPDVGLLVPEAAVVAYDSMIPQVEKPNAHNAQLPSLMGNKAALLFEDGQHEKALTVHRQLVKQFGASNVPEVMNVVARAKFNLGLALQNRGALDEAANAYDDVVSRYRDVDSVELQEMVIEARSNKAMLLVRQNQTEAALKIYRTIASNIRMPRLQALEWQRSQALVNIGSCQAMLGQHKAAVRTWERLVRESSGLSDIKIDRAVARAMNRIATIQLVTGATESALQSISKLLERYHESADHFIRQAVALSFVVRGHAHEKLKQMEEALATYRQLQDDFGDVLGPDGISLRWRAILEQTRITIGDQSAGVDAVAAALRLLYSATDLENDKNVTEMYLWMVVWVAAGSIAPAELASILASDPQKTEIFRPFEIALRRMSGEATRVPIQIAEVANDIWKMIDQVKAILDGLPETGTVQDAHASLGGPTSVIRSLVNRVLRRRSPHHRQRRHPDIHGFD